MQKASVPGILVCLFVCLFPVLDPFITSCFLSFVSFWVSWSIHNHSRQTPIQVPSTMQISTSEGLNIQSGRCSVYPTQSSLTGVTQLFNSHVNYSMLRNTMSSAVLQLGHSVLSTTFWLPFLFHFFSQSCFLCARLKVSPRCVCLIVIINLIQVCLKAAYFVLLLAECITILGQRVHRAISLLCQWADFHIQYTGAVCHCALMFITVLYVLPCCSDNAQRWFYITWATLKD